MWIRDAVIGDARAIAQVHVRSWQAAYRGLLPADVLDGLSIDERARTWTTWLAAVEPPAAVLVVQDERILGFAAVGARRGGAADEGELRAIYLAPDAWDRGAGRLLHAAAVARLQEAEFATATLWVLEGNERAIRFYRRAGWRLDGTFRMDVGPAGVELPELLMRQALSPDTV